MSSLRVRRICDLVTREGSLVERAQFDSVLDPQELRVRFADGIGDAEWTRLDGTWYTSGAYRFHYIDADDGNWRFDTHPNPRSAEAHFHPPPNAPSETAMRSRDEEPRLVARAVVKLWRRAFETGTFEAINSAENPP